MRLVKHFTFVSVSANMRLTSKAPLQNRQEGYQIRHGSTALAAMLHIGVLRGSTLLDLKSCVIRTCIVAPYCKARKKCNTVLNHAQIPIKQDKEVLKTDQKRGCPSYQKAKKPPWR